MVSLVSISYIVTMVSDVTLLVISFISLLKFKKKWQKTVSGLILVVCLSNIFLTYYLKPAPNEIHANLSINVYEPLVISKNGNYKDNYTIKPEYSVLCGSRLPLGTDLSIKLTNLKTFQNNKYDIFDVSQGKIISNISSGKYKVEIYINNKLAQTNNIELSANNLGDDGQWQYSAYVIGDFFSVATREKIKIPIEDYEKIAVPVYTIYSDKTYICSMFKEEYNEELGELEGDYYFVPDVYYLNNAVNPTEMETIVIDTL